MQSRETVLVAIENSVATVTVSRPKALNALNRQVLTELEQVVAEIAHSSEVGCVILTGAGDKAFVAGADIAEMTAMTPHQAEAFSMLGQRVFDAIEALPMPVLAAVNGFALGGGCELALACDIIYASERAKFGQPEVKLGLMPGFGGAVRLPRKVGLAVASEWIFTGETYAADVAQKVGLVREILAPDALQKRVREVADLIAKRGPLAVRAAKKVLTAGLETTPSAALAFERWSFGQLFATADMKEGTQAFLAKRDPAFQGK